MEDEYNPIVPGTRKDKNVCWTYFREFINTKEIGHRFKRSDFKIISNVKKFNMGTLDTFRNMLVRAGFFTIVDRGTYELKNKIPAGTTTTELYSLAFGSKLEYLEKVVGRKERERRQAEEQARLLELQRVNTAILTEARSKPCKDCNLPLSDFVKIFSYRQPQTKYYAFTQFTLAPTEKLQNELEKCDLICLNCHAIRVHDGLHSVYQEV